MLSIKQKITTGMAVATMMGSVMAPAALADTNTISGNGRDSESTINVSGGSNTVVAQGNFAIIVNNVTTVAKTGGNEAKDNVGAGDVDVDSGNATATSTVTNTLGGNSANITGCGCPEGDDVNRISGNGRDSKNKITVNKSKNNVYLQGNAAIIGNNVTTKAKTGKNKAKDNVGTGNKTVNSGNANATTNVTTTTGSNTLDVTP